MSPIDTTPHGGEIMHEPPQHRFPEPRPDGAGDESVPGSTGTDEVGDVPDIEHRPTLPDHPARTAVDIEDEEADPVIESGPGRYHVRSLKKQKG